MATVLIIEDELNIRLFISTNLEVRGYHVLEAGSGAEGLAQFAQHPPDVIILDMMLPDMDGWQVLARLVEDPRGQATPVILMTAAMRVADPDGRQYPNLADHLTKPVSVETLIQAVQRVLARPG